MPLNAIALFAVVTFVLAVKLTGPAKVIEAGFVPPSVTAPFKVVKPVCVLLPMTKPVNFPPLPKIESVPARIAEVTVTVLPVTPLTPIVPPTEYGASVSVPPAL